MLALTDKELISMCIYIYINSKYKQTYSYMHTHICSLHIIFVTHLIAKENYLFKSQSKQILLKQIHTDEQHMLKIMNHSWNHKSKPQWGIIPVCYQKVKKCWPGYGERGPSLTVGAMQLSATIEENNIAIPQKLKTEIPWCVAIPLLDGFPREIKSFCSGATCSPIALFTRDKKHKQSKCSPTVEFIKKVWHTCTVDAYSQTEKGWILSFATS